MLYNGQLSRLPCYYSVRLSRFLDRSVQVMFPDGRETIRVVEQPVVAGTHKTARRGTIVPFLYA
jgi:hypothetical protein